MSLNPEMNEKSWQIWILWIKENTDKEIYNIKGKIIHHDLFK